MVSENLGRNIRKCRLSLSWTQEKLADVLCVSHQVVSKWENGIASPDIDTLCSLIKIFDVSLDELCGIAPKKVDVIVDDNNLIRCYKNKFADNDHLQNSSCAAVSDFLKELEELSNRLPLLTRTTS